MRRRDERNGDEDLQRDHKAKSMCSPTRAKNTNQSDIQKGRCVGCKQLPPDLYIIGSVHCFTPDCTQGSTHTNNLTRGWNNAVKNKKSPCTCLRLTSPRPLTKSSMSSCGSHWNIVTLNNKDTLNSCRSCTQIKKRLS